MSSIVEVSMNKIALLIRVGADDSTAERVVIPNNDTDGILKKVKVKKKS